MPSTINNRAPSYFIACGLQRCGHCRKLTPVVGLVLPAGHETLEVDADVALGALANDAWETAEVGAILFDVEYLPEAVENRLRQLSQHYRADRGEATERLSWTNHCAFCGAPQADVELYCEPEGAFMPISPEAAAKIQLYEVREAFEAQSAGYAYAPEFLEYAQQVLCAG